MSLEKMKKMAGRLETVIRVLQKVLVICMAAAVCAAAVLTAVSVVNPEIALGESTVTVDAGYLSLELEPEQQPENGEILTLAWISLALYAVYGAGIWYVLGIFRRILQPMKDGDPFAGTVSRDIRKIGWSAVVMGVVSNLVTMLEVMAEWQMWGQKAADSVFIRSVTVNYTFDIGFLFVFAVLMLIAWIFEYGAELQKLSDETL